MTTASRIRIGLGIILAATALPALAATATAPAPAPATATATHAQPHEGWTIRPRLVVNPRGVVEMTALPHCRHEDGSGQRSACTWNIGPGTDGNGIGAAYWVDRADRTHYVWATSPLGPGWHWSNRAQSQAMGRTDCIVKNGTTVASGLVARCAG